MKSWSILHSHGVLDYTSTVHVWPYLPIVLFIWTVFMVFKLLRECATSDVSFSPDRNEDCNGKDTKHISKKRKWEALSVGPQVHSHNLQLEESLIDW